MFRFINIPISCQKKRKLWKKHENVGNNNLYRALENSTVKV